MFTSTPGRADRLEGVAMNSAVRTDEVVLLIFGFLKEHYSSFPQTCDALEKEAAGILRPRRPSMKSLPSILGEYLALSEEQQKRLEFVAKIQNDSIASQTVTSVFENLFTLLDDYRAVRQTFVPHITRSSVLEPMPNDQQLGDEGSQQTQNANSGRFQDSSLGPAVCTGPETWMPTSRIGRAGKRARKGTPSYHAGGTSSVSSQPFIVDYSIGVHPGDQFNEGYADTSKESEAQGAGTMVEEAPKDYPDDHFHSIYSDISECVLSDPQVLLAYAARPNFPGIFKAHREQMGLECGP